MIAKAVAIYGDACQNAEKETEDLNRLLSLQAYLVLMCDVLSMPLEDAWHLAQRYSRMRQEAEAQAAEVSKRQARVREIPCSRSEMASSRGEDAGVEGKHGRSR
ncbi:SH3 domain-containing protein 3 [Linum grandiflorum]